MEVEEVEKPLALLALFCVKFPPLPNLEIFRPWNIFDKQLVFMTMKNKGQNLCFYPKNPLTETSRLLRRFLSSKMTFQGAFFAIWCKQLINHHLHISSSITDIQLNITSSGSPSLESEVIFILGTGPKMTHLLCTAWNPWHNPLLQCWTTLLQIKNHDAVESIWI